MNLIILEIIEESWIYWKSWLYWWHGDRILDDTDTRNRCFDHVNVLCLMSNHAQTILHEIPLLDEPTDTPRQKFTVQKTTLFTNNSPFSSIKMKHFSIDHNSSSVHSWQIVVFESSPRRPITLRILKEMRLYMKSLRKSDYTRNHDYVDGMAIMFWLIRIREIVVLTMLTCSIWCLTMRKRFYTEFHF